MEQWTKDRFLYYVAGALLVLAYSLLWFLDTPMYVALILLSQHWLTAIIGIPGIACVYLISRQEDLRLIEKFGDDYKHYMQKVPRMNLLAGIIRLVRR
jgi:protein-S-isoprenylcysteine O-methyltransferase Ste14